MSLSVKRRAMTNRVEVNPDILLGKPVIAGTRIPVYLILNLLASGYDFARILEAYPVLNEEDIRAALEHDVERVLQQPGAPQPGRSWDQGVTTD